jgi:hypothetical protein
MRRADKTTGRQASRRAQFAGLEAVASYVAHMPVAVRSWRVCATITPLGGVGQGGEPSSKKAYGLLTGNAFPAPDFVSSAVSGVSPSRGSLLVDLFQVLAVGGRRVVAGTCSGLSPSQGMLDK